MCARPTYYRTLRVVLITHLIVEMLSVKRRGIDNNMGVELPGIIT